MSNLRSAMQSGNLEAVKRLLEQGADVNENLEYDQTALHEAAVCSNPKLVELLLQYGADVNAKTNGDIAPLHLSVLKNTQYMGALIMKREIKKLMQKQGKDFDMEDEDSAEGVRNSVKVADLLLQSNADSNAKSGDGRTPLIIVAEGGSSEMAALLLRQGADVNVRGKSGLLQERRGWTPLHFAAENNLLEIVALLLQHGVSIDDTDDDGRTPLHYAVWNNALDTVKLLLKHGADVNITIKDSWPVGGWTPKYAAEPGTTTLHMAVWNNSSEMIKLLLQQKGIDIEAQQKTGSTPLHIAAYCNAVESAKLLLQSGANINASKKGKFDTPLHAAAWHNRLDMVTLLLEQGAKVNAKGKFGRTPMDCALIEGGRNRLQQIIQRHGGEINCGKLKHFMFRIIRRFENKVDNLAQQNESR